MSSLTHHDPQAGEACVLWCLAIDHAVRAGELDVRAGLDRVGPEWRGWLDEAEQAPPEAFARSNGWDTDTVAAIAGGLLGAALRRERGAR